MRQILCIFFTLPLFLFNSFPLLAQVSWDEKAKMSISRTQTMGFAIGEKGYLICGYDEEVNGSNQLWEWDQATNTWSEKANLPGEARASGIAFAIGDKGYVGLGYEFGYYTDLWEWDQATNTWTEKAAFPGTGRGQSAVFVIGNKAYIAGGFGSGVDRQDELWEWDQSTNSWSEKSNLPEELSGSTAFSMGNKGYVVSGNTVPWQSNHLWEWDQATDTWTAKADLVVARAGAGSFAYGDKAYVFTGEGETYLNDLWMWDRLTDTWTQLIDLPGDARARGAYFSISNKGYIVGGAIGPANFYNEIWELEVPLATSTHNTLALADRPNLFPIPCDEQLQIQFDAPPREVHLRLTDVLGRQIAIDNIELARTGSGQLNTQNLASGLYTLTVETEAGVYSEQIAVQH